MGTGRMLAYHRSAWPISFWTSFRPTRRIARSGDEMICCGALAMRMAASVFLPWAVPCFRPALRWPRAAVHAFDGRNGG